MDLRRKAYKVLREHLEGDSGMLFVLDVLYGDSAVEPATQQDLIIKASDVIPEKPTPVVSRQVPMKTKVGIKSFQGKGDLLDGVIVSLRADGASIKEIVEGITLEGTPHNYDEENLANYARAMTSKYRWHIQQMKALSPGDSRFKFLQKYFGWGCASAKTS